MTCVLSWYLEKGTKGQNVPSVVRIFKFGLAIQILLSDLNVPSIIYDLSK